MGLADVHQAEEPIAEKQEIGRAYQRREIYCKMNICKSYFMDLDGRLKYKTLNGTNENAKEINRQTRRNNEVQVKNPRADEENNPTTASDHFPWI